MKVSENQNHTPVPEFDDRSGYLFIKVQGARQVLVRVGDGDGTLYFYHRRAKKEIPVSVDLLYKLAYQEP